MMDKEHIKILFFDDDKGFLNDYTAILERKGYHVKPVSSSRDVFDLLETSMDKYDVFILDILEGPDAASVGLDMLAEINPRESGKKVIMCSVTDAIEYAIEPINKGAFHYLHKGQIATEVFLRVVENAVKVANLEKRQQSDLERQRSDLKKMVALQRSLFPRSSSLHRSLFDIEAQCKPAHKISGDFYTFVARGDDKQGIFLGDVEGHGMAAGFITGIAYATLNGIEHEALSDEQFLNEFITRLKPLLGSELAITYITACYCVLDDSNRSLRYKVLGQPAPFWYRAQSGHCETLDEGTVPFIHPHIPVAVDDLEHVQLEPGDIVVLCTDGIDTLFDSNPLEAIAKIKKMIEKHGNDDPKQIVAALLDNDPTRDDDKTVIVIKCK